MDFIRRPGGSLEPIRKLGGRRVLLPYEAQLCNTLGISEKEYFEFVELAEVACHERKRGYEHIPDIVNMPQALVPVLVSAGMGAGAAAIVSQVIVGVAISAIGYLLTPKPKTPESPPTLTLGGVQGRSRFAPQSEFSSVQELAVLGTFIPLVYSRKGVRVNGQLLWSHLKTTGTGQILSVITLFSNGELGEKPDFESFAIGTNFLTGFSKRRLALYFSNGASAFNRLKKSDKYPETDAPDGHNLANRGVNEFDSSDPFKVREIVNTIPSTSSFNFHKDFSSVITQADKSSFGAYGPIPNAMGYRVPWEVIMFPKGIKRTVEENNNIKISKILHRYPRLCGIVGNARDADKSVSNDYEITYRIIGSNDAFVETSTDGDEGLANKFSPWGSKDAKAAVDTTRESVDDLLEVGQQYLIGSALATCTSEENGEIWTPENSITKDYKFTVDEAGTIEEFTKENIKDYAKHPFDSLTIQKVSIGTISNIRSCEVTEIGIKSKVFRRINGFPNVNSMVSREIQEDYEEDGGSIGLGSMTKYVDRLSFFKLEGKPQSETTYKDLTGYVLCIRGSSPIEVYNTFQINTGGVLYDFRFVPMSGNFVLRTKKTVYQVSHNGRLQRRECRFNSGNINVYFNADPVTLPGGSGWGEGEMVTGDTGNRHTNNPEWFVEGSAASLGSSSNGGSSSGSGSGSSVGGFVSGLSHFDNGVNKPSSGSTFVDDTTSNPENLNQLQNGSFAGSYFNAANGVVISLDKGSTVWTWTYTYGGTEIPEPIVVTTSPGEYPITTVQDPNTGAVTVIPHYTTPVTGTDGVRRRFGLANDTPFNRFNSIDGGSNLYSLKKQIEQAGGNVTTTTPVATVENIGNTSGTGLSFALTKIVGSSGPTYYSWEVDNAGDGYFTGDKVRIKDGGVTVYEVELRVDEKGEIGNGQQFSSTASSDEIDDQRDRYWALKNLNPNNAIADYYLYDAEDSSHASSPEHEIVFMNEIKHFRGPESIDYPHLAIAGLRINSTKEINSFSQLSALIKKGIKVKRLINNSGSFVNHGSLNDSTNNFVEIAYDLLTNEQYGAAELIGVRGVNRGEMQQAAQYCHANDFTWDGVIDRRFNLREFIFENAGFNLLDFSVKGGQFSLRPAFPVNTAQKINYDAKTDAGGGIDIRALFSDGNMRNLQVSFLTPEEREVFKATILFRKDEIESNGFPETEVRTYAYKNDGQSVEDMRDLPEEVFDLSNWCTSEAQAHLFAAIALATRKEVDHGITFETTPTSVLGLLAGDYIRVISEVTHTSRFTNGSIDEDGFVTCRDDIRNIGTPIQIYYWKPGNLGQVQSDWLSVNSDWKATNSKFNGTLFARVDTTEEDRLYKVESISYGEEGFIKVAASHQPLTSDNKLAILHRASPARINEFFPNILL